MTAPDSCGEAQLHILQHSLGLNAYGQGTPCRNHFVTGPGSADHATCTALVAAGFMTRMAGNALTGGDDLFTVTEAGRAFVTKNSPPPPKLTQGQRRYRRYLAADSGQTFGEWLKAVRP